MLRLPPRSAKLAAHAKISAGLHDECEDTITDATPSSKAKNVKVSKRQSLKLARERTEYNHAQCSYLGNEFDKYVLEGLMCVTMSKPRLMLLRRVNTFIRGVIDGSKLLCLKIHSHDHPTFDFEITSSVNVSDRARLVVAATNLGGRQREPGLKSQAAKKSILFYSHIDPASLSDRPQDHSIMPQIGWQRIRELEAELAQDPWCGMTVVDWQDKRPLYLELLTCCAACKSLAPHDLRSGTFVALPTAFEEEESEMLVQAAALAKQGIGPHLDKRASARCSRARKEFIVLLQHDRYGGGHNHDAMTVTAGLRWMELSSQSTVHLCATEAFATSFIYDSDTVSSLSRFDGVQYEPYLAGDRPYVCLVSETVHPNDFRHILELGGWDELGRMGGGVVFTSVDSLCEQLSIRVDAGSMHGATLLVNVVGHMEASVESSLRSRLGSILRPSEHNLTSSFLACHVRNTFHSLFIPARYTGTYTPDQFTGNLIKFSEPSAKILAQIVHTESSTQQRAQSLVQRLARPTSLSCFQMLLDTCHTLWSTPMHRSRSCRVSLSAYHFAEGFAGSRSFGVEEYAGRFELRTSLEQGHQGTPLFSTPSAFTFWKMSGIPYPSNSWATSWAEMSAEAKQPYAEKHSAHKQMLLEAQSSSSRIRWIAGDKNMRQKGCPFLVLLFEDGTVRLSLCPDTSWQSLDAIKPIVDVSHLASNEQVLGASVSQNLVLLRTVKSAVLVHVEWNVTGFKFGTVNVIHRGKSLAAALCHPEQTSAVVFLSTKEGLFSAAPLLEHTVEPATEIKNMLGRVISNQLPLNKFHHIMPHSTVHVSCSPTHALAVDEHGELWGWGDAAHGRLGIYSQTRIPVPRMLLGGQNLVKCSTNEGHSIVQTFDGRLLSCGIISRLGTGDARAITNKKRESECCQYAFKEMDGEAYQSARERHLIPREFCATGSTTRVVFQPGCVPDMRSVKKQASPQPQSEINRVMLSMGWCIDSMAGCENKEILASALSELRTLVAIDRQPKRPTKKRRHQR